MRRPARLTSSALRKENFLFSRCTYSSLWVAFIPLNEIHFWYNRLSEMYVIKRSKRGRVRVIIYLFLLKSSPTKRSFLIYSGFELYLGVRSLCELKRLFTFGHRTHTQSRWLAHTRVHSHLLVHSRKYLYILTQSCTGAFLICNLIKWMCRVLSV